MDYTYVGYMIFMASIAIFMIVDSLYSYHKVAYIICAVAGVLNLIVCKKIKEGIKTFKVLLIFGGVFLVIGSIIVYSTDYVPAIAIGFLLSAVGIITIFNFLPIVIYKDITILRSKNF